MKKKKLTKKQLVNFFNTGLICGEIGKPRKIRAKIKGVTFEEVDLFGALRSIKKKREKT
jgi:hypothetical protein